MAHLTRDRASAAIEQRIVVGELAAGAPLDEGVLASELGAPTAIVREALSGLQRDGLVRPAGGDRFAVSDLDEAELRETYPIVLLLEGLAVRTAPTFGPPAIARLREINAEMARDSAERGAAVMHDHAFHEELARHCANEQLVLTLRPLKRLLLRYELAYMAIEDHVGTSVGQHAEIIDHLDRGDHQAAAATVEANFRDSLPGLLARI